MYSDNENPPNIPKHNFHNLLNIATKETFFMFNNKYYKQVDGVSMGSPLGPALANIFMCSFESKWLRDCPNDFKPVFYRRYIDDIFALFSSPDHADKFREYLSSKHPNIEFSIEKEQDGCLPFLDVNIFRENDKFATNVYRKKTFSGVYTNFKSFIPETYKIGTFHIFSIMFEINFERYLTYTGFCCDNLLITQIVCVELGLHESTFNDFPGLCSTWLLTTVVLPIMS